MIQPVPMGRFLYPDANGFLHFDGSYDLIHGPWRELVDFVQSSLLESGLVEAVYIRGSVPRGLAVENVSDADFLYFSNSETEDLEKFLEKEVKSRFPFVRDLELLKLESQKMSEVYAPQTRPYFQMLLKTQSLFLGGQDLVQNVEPFRLGLNMSSHIFALAEEFESLAAWLEDDRVKGKEKQTRQWFFRRLIRSGFEVVMERANCFTRDLYLCYEEFSKFYPTRKEQMYGVLLNSLNGHEDPLQYKELVTFLDAEFKA